MADAASVKDLLRRALLANTLSYFAPAILAHDSIYAAVLREYDDPNATVGFGRKDGTQHQRRLRDDLGAIQAHLAKGREFTLPLLVGALSAVIVAVEDEMKRAKLRDRTKPEREFLRHLRNACAHGNTFYFTKGEPRAAASFKGFVLDASMHGKCDVLFDYIFPGDVYDLLEFIAGRL
jgi:hypothetical protein